MRAPRALVVALLLVAVTGVPTASADADDLSRARRRANEAAEALADAQSQRADLESEIVALEAQAAATEAELTAVGARVREVALAEFMGADGAAGLPVLDADHERRRALVGYVTGADEDAVDRYLALSEDLTAQREALGRRQEEAASAVEVLDRRADEAMAELVEVEREEAARREREAAEARARAAEAERRAAASRPVSGSGSSTRALAPARSSGGSAAPAVIDSGGDWLCPVAGARAFSNDWGQPRSGGRRHQGTDILSPRGTPVVASVSGSVRGHSSSLGGVSYYLAGDDGNTYFGTHLDSLSGASGHVAQGTVVGYIGNTGNARGGATHLHFEIHPGGGGPVNPYPTLARHC